MSQHREKDESDTRLLDGQWVPKSHDRCEAFGTIDEAVSVLGLARRFCHPEITALIDTIQKDLFIVSAELATASADHSTLQKESRAVSEAMVQKLDDLLDTLKSSVAMPERFIIPGESSTGAAVLDMARAIIRRAERQAVRLKDKESGNIHLLRYLNRLSMVIFLLARSQEAKEA